MVQLDMITQHRKAPVDMALLHIAFTIHDRRAFRVQDRAQGGQVRVDY